MILRVSWVAWQTYKQRATLSGIVRCSTSALSSQDAHQHLVTSPTPSDDRSDYFCLGDDSLPPFSLLTTDEERERKAEATSPGTYHVVVVPDSFSTLPEYADDGTEKTKPRSSGESQRSADISPLSLNLNGLKCENVSNDDPNLVILKTFEDATRRSSSIGRISRVSPTSEISDPLCSLSLSPIIVSLPSEGDIEDDIKPQLLGDLHIDPHNDYYNEDTMLFAHFRDVVWRQLFPTAHGVGDPHWSEGHGSTLSVDLIEREAAHFPPVSNLDHRKTLSRLMESSFLTQSELCRLLACRSLVQSSILTRCSTTSKPSHHSRPACGTMTISSRMGCS